MVLTALIEWERRTRERIHSIRIPIKDKRTLFLVQCLYFITPVVLGTMVMQMVIPNPEQLRGKITAPTPEEQALIDAEKKRLQEQLDSARAARSR